MATLEKIRNKSVLLFVIIIVALLAFILGDFLTSGRTYFSDPTTVAKAGGQKVEYQEYQDRLSRLSEQQRGRTYDADAASQQVINDILLEKLFKQECRDLGIVVTDKEISEAMTGENLHPAAYQTIAYLSQQLGLPAASGADVFQAMSQPAKYGLPTEAGTQIRQIWSETEKQVEEQLLGAKFYRLLGGLFGYNNLDAKAIYDDNAATRHISYVSKDVASVSDDDVEFGDADIQAYWNAHKNDYKLNEEMRNVDYIYVAIEPSQADRMAAQQAVEAAVAALSEQPGTEAVQTDSRFSINRNTTTAAGINDRRLKSFVTDSVAGKAAVINQTNTSYTIAKVLSTKQGIDSLNVTMLSAQDPTILDSLAAALNSGTRFDALVDNTTIGGQDSIWASLEAPGIDAKLKAALTEATPGKAFVYTDTVNGEAASAIYRVNRRHAPVTFYEVATIEYGIDPSNETLEKLTQDLRTYVSNNSSAADFTENASNAGYSVQSAQVGASSSRLGMASDSRKFVKWAMDAKKGQVSPMLQDDKQSYLIAMAVTDIYDKGYLPANSPAIATQLRQQALNSKKADKLMADYAGKANDVAGYAKAMGAEAAESNVNFNSPVFLNMGIYESALQGAVAAAEKGKTVGPVKGNHAVLVFEVTDVNTDNRPFTAEEYGQRFNQTFGMGRLQSPLPLLLGKNKVDNKSLNFISPVGE
ncbi:MAG: SurA N-terminal domain-containing protein [Muribaculaceae bacterium]|nr:SurA N-terminal domain-containing protein [Muribaculaceae bacterium]